MNIKALEATKMTLKQLVTVVIAFVFVACSSLSGEEVARLEINKVSTKSNYVLKEASLELKKDDEITFWSEMDFEFEGDITPVFRVKIFKDDVANYQLTVDPIKKNVTLGEFKKSINNKTQWSFTGKNKTIKIKEDGSYTFKAILFAKPNPSLKINKAELVLKK